MSNELIPYDQVEKMAIALAKSTLFGMKTPEQAIALCLLAQAEGLHPVTAARDYHIIQGRPALKADAMLARFQASGGVVRWTCYTQQQVTGVFSHPSSPQPVEVTWTIEMAKAISIDVWEDTAQGRRKVQKPMTEKDNWHNFPRAMLRSRVISEGVRTVYPGVLQGMYTPEEMENVVGQPPPTKTERPERVINPDAAPMAELPSPPRETPANPMVSRELLSTLAADVNAIWRVDDLADWWKSQKTRITRLSTDDRQELVAICAQRKMDIQKAETEDAAEAAEFGEDDK